MCKDFVTGSLNSTLTAEGVADIIDYNFYPWGNAYYNTTECGTAEYDKQVGMTCWLKDCGGASPSSDCFEGIVLCQHGDQECDLNLAEACAVYLYKEIDMMAVAEFTYCLESARFKPSIPKCAARTGLDSSKLESCMNMGPAGPANVAVAKATAALQPPHLGTPWVIVNGEQLDDPDNLLATVCSLYDGTKPAGCKKANLSKRDVVSNITLFSF